MTEKSEPKLPEVEPLTFFQRWVAWMVGAVLFITLAAYHIKFDGSISASQAKWGQFGDFVGGSVNPIIGFFTILLLSVSLRQNQVALSQANAALAQAKQELELTRLAIEQASGIQKATETALKEQIAIASHARDLNNGITLWVALKEQSARLREQWRSELKADGRETSKSFNTLEKIKPLECDINKLEGIMDLEIDRLSKEYPSPSEL